MACSAAMNTIRAPLNLARPSPPPATTRRDVSMRAQLVKVKPRLPQQMDYSPGPFDAISLNLFRRKMAQEVGWDSSKPGYDGLIEIAHYLFKKSKDRREAETASVRIQRSLFPPFLLPLFRALISPLLGGKPAAILTARVTQATCQWLMGSCSVNTIELQDGSSLGSGVLVDRCKYLEESKCAGVCIHTCKIPSQTFISEYMGVPLTMEPNFEDLSCQFKFGVEAPAREDDESLKTPCLDICPTALTRPISTKSSVAERCPQVATIVLSTYYTYEMDGVHSGSHPCQETNFWGRTSSWRSISSKRRMKM